MSSPITASLLSVFLRIGTLTAAFGCFSIVGVWAAEPVSGGGVPVGEVAWFETNVRPILAKRCYDCHSVESGKQKGGLLLDSYEGWAAGGDSGEVIEPGKPDGSLLMKAVERKDKDTAMPPKTPLPEAEVAILREWIARGAHDPRRANAPAVKRTIDVEAGRKFWAFQPLSKPAVPSAPGSTAVDRFLNSKLNAASIKPVGPADRSTWLRRVTFDLTGLPPTPGEIRDFLTDKSPEATARARVADRLLASLAFGERWGRHWLDIVRYAESMGRTRNVILPEAWRYRNYVVAAFNADKPYDQFIREQLAGDLLPATSPEQKSAQLVATGFLALGSLDLNERDSLQAKMDLVDEQIDVVGRSFMALTIACARCHDHKFDPIPTEDYYALSGIFTSTRTLNGVTHRKAGAGRDYSAPENLISLPQANVRVNSVAGSSAPGSTTAARPVSVGEGKRFGKGKAIPQLQKKFAERARELFPSSDKARDAFREFRAGNTAGLKPDQLAFLQKFADKRAEALGETASPAVVQSSASAPASVPSAPAAVSRAMGAGEGGAANQRVAIRGEARNYGALVPRGFVQVASYPEAPTIPVTQSGRLQLAEWLLNPRHPLTARVMVNRVWQHLFGRGIVATVDNFGETGERPSHPELLDFLATTFMENGWSVKRLVRELVLSDAYGRSSEHSAAAAALDPENRLLWRASLRRLDAEGIRDALLVVSETLEHRSEPSSPLAGRSSVIFKGNGREPELFGSNLRSLYLPVVRNFTPDFLDVFDFADPSQVIGQRDVTTVAPQALFFMNSSIVATAAKQTSEKVRAYSPEESMRIANTYYRILNRPPTTAEVDSASSYLRQSGAPEPVAFTLLCQALIGSAEFRYLR